jgi:plasmid maintenance system antidote protein VapI
MTRRRYGKTLAENLRQLIRDSGLTVAAIARATGIAQPVLSRFVRGQRDLTLRTADKLLKYFEQEEREERRFRAKGGGT